VGLETALLPLRQSPRTARCDNSTHVPADEMEQQFIDYLRGAVLGEIEQSIRDAIRGEVRRVAETADARASEAEPLKSEIESLRRERQRLVRLASATDPWPNAWRTRPWRKCTGCASS
jgi:hypothetical protein